MKSLKLTEKDWLKLRDYSKLFAGRIQRNLPVDWAITLEEIEGVVFDTFIYLLGNYKEGAMSAVSYCYQFGEKITIKKLLKEYREIIKTHLKFVDNPIDEEYKDIYGHTIDMCHQIVEGAELHNETLQANLEKRDKLQSVIDKASDEDKQIMKMIYDGYSMDEIAKKFNTNKMSISRRLKKYGKDN